MASLRAAALLLPLVLMLSSRSVRASVNGCVDPSVTWWFGKNGENPCQMYETLVRVCDPSFRIKGVPDIHSCTHTPCHRSSVAYSLASACSLCQGAKEPLPSYREYQQCADSGSLAVQADREHSTSIPNWAHIPLIPSDTWSYEHVKARALADSPQPPVHILAAKPTNTAADSQNNLPAIIGGVLGGIAAITIGILFGYLWFRRVQKKEKAAAALQAQAFIPSNPQFHQYGVPMVPHPQYGSPQLLPFRPSGGPPMERFTPSPSHSPSPGRPRTKGAVVPAPVNRYDTVEPYRSPPPPPSTNPPSSHTQSPPPSHRHQPSEPLVSPIPAPLPAPIVRYETEEDAGLAQETVDGRIEVVRLPPSYRNEWYRG